MRLRWLHALAVGLAAAPLAVFGIRAATSGLGANPIEELSHLTGEWTLRLLILTLAVTPARRWLGLSRLAPLRRTLGLACFAMACLHLLTYAALDQFFDWRAIVEDVAERRYIALGFAGFLCLVPLALTSTRRSIRRLGRRWTKLHRLVWLAAACGVLHYAWLVKGDDLLGPLLHGGLLVGLLALRFSPPTRAPARDGCSPDRPSP